MSASQPRPFRVVPHTRPLLFAGGELLCARYDRIVATDDLGLTFREVGVLQVRGPAAAAVRHSTIAQRIMRASVYRLRKLETGALVAVFRKGIYSSERSNPSRLVRRFAIREGSRPVSLAARPGGPVVFGEYWGNSGRDRIRIWGSFDYGQTWSPVWTFNAGEVRHVHGITWDPWDDCFWICTGDDGDECRLIRTNADFSDVRIALQGGQRNRFYSMAAGPRFLTMATDTPLEQNFIVAFDKRTSRVRVLQAVENSSFYHCRVGDLLFWSTIAEPSSINSTSASHVWVGSEGQQDWRPAFSLPVDVLGATAPISSRLQALFQYPRIFFPEGENPSQTLVCHAIGLRGVHDAMLCYDALTWST